MRRVTNALGADTTAVVLAAIQNARELHVQELYAINSPVYYQGEEAIDPVTFLVTPAPSPLAYTPVGIFRPSVISRDQLTIETGLRASECKVRWSPNPAYLYDIPNLESELVPPVDLYEHARRGDLDNGAVRIWRAYMPTYGDCNTWGVSSLFLGRIAKVDVDDFGIDLTVRNYLDILDQQIPRHLITGGNRDALLGRAGSATSRGAAFADTLQTLGGSTKTKIAFENVGSPSTIYPEEQFLGFYALIAGTLQRAVRTNANAGGVNYLYLVESLPVAPAAGAALTLYGPLPTANQADATLPGFPYVPRSEDQI